MADNRPVDAERFSKADRNSMTADMRTRRSAKRMKAGQTNDGVPPAPCRAALPRQRPFTIRYANTHESGRAAKRTPCCWTCSTTYPAPNNAHRLARRVPRAIRGRLFYMANTRFCRGTCHAAQQRNWRSATPNLTQVQPPASRRD